MKSIRGFIRNGIVQTAAVAIGFYWFLAAVLPNDELLAFLRVLLMTASIAVVIAYSRPVLSALSRNEYDRAVHLTLGITLGWLATVLSSVWALLWRVSGQPSWMMNNDLVGAFFWLQFLAAHLHLTAPGAVDGSVPRRSWIIIGVTVAVALLIFVLLVFERPDLRALVDELEHFIPN